MAVILIGYVVIIFVRLLHNTDVLRLLGCLILVRRFWVSDLLRIGLPSSALVVAVV